MKNLKIVHDSVKNIKSNLPVTSCAWDPTSDTIWFTLGPAPSNPVIELRRVAATATGSADQSEIIATWDAPCPLPGLRVDEILDFHYFSHTSTSCLVLAGGDIVNVRHAPLPGEERIEIIGSVDEGITAAAWSPDEELLLLTTRANTLLFMTIEFENVASVTLSAEDAKLSKHVSVGWGKKETQFQGKRAKALRDPTMPERVDEGVLLDSDSERLSISWRGDGAYVAVNAIVEVEGSRRRMIRVFSREGVLDSVTEPVDGLTGSVSWRPAGNLIAGVQQISKTEIKVVFFERNGLRHGQFPLKLTNENSSASVGSIDLAWNVDSSALAVCLQDRVQIWTMGNYHYYLKQEIHETASTKLKALEFMSICWHPEEPHRIASFASNENCPEGQGGHATIRSTSMVPTVCTGSPVPPNDYGTMLVIDGSNLKITPLRKANVPPPMALHEIDIGEKSQIRDVAVNQSNTRIAALCEGSVLIIDFTPTDLDLKPSIQKIVRLPDEVVKYACQICFKGDSDIFALFSETVSGGDMVYDLSTARICLISSAPMTTFLFPSIEHKSLCASISGSIVELVLNYETGIADTNLICISPSNVIRVEVMQFEEHSLACMLTARGGLYANERQLVKNCTSFVLTTSHIIFTTTNHLIKFIHLTARTELDVPPDEPETDERCRSIERGARLVAVMPSAYSLTLQMPRGNLETIYPRALVLASIRRNIKKREYRRAFLACRSQRVDMNIIHDYAPAQFLADIKLVIEQLKTVEYIDLLLSQLNDTDVSKILYKETLSKTQASGLNPNVLQNVSDASVEAPGKVNRICDAFLAVLQDKFETNLQNVITANACKIPPNIEAGLDVVASLSQKDEKLADSALEHMCFLTDVNLVYERALGMYDLDLALLVAQQSQKDPREYLPYLQSLQNMELLRRKFTIDNDLRHFSRALAHLQSLNAFDELKTFTEKHELYREALDLYRYSPEQWRELLRLHADFLNSRNRFKEAAIAYEFLPDLPSALSAYRSAAFWSPCLSTAALIPLPPSELHALALDLRTSLVESKDYLPAATISLDYLSDVPAAITHLCAGFKPGSAIRTATAHGRADLLSSTLDPALARAAGELMELLADCKSQCVAQTARLKEVRAIKANDPLRFFGETPQGEGDVPDDISLAPTQSSVNPSLFTRYGGASSVGLSTVGSQVSRRTSKNRRREERKRARGKKGSVYEEEYLVGSVERLIGRVEEARGDVAEVVEACLRRGMWERGRACEDAVQEVVGLLRGCLGWVFEGPNAGMANGEGMESGARPMGGQGVYWDHLQVEEGKVRREAPVVRPFERSPLIS